MTEHLCLHELDLNQLSNDISVIKDSIIRIEKRLDQQGAVIFGNGKQGHTTQPCGPWAWFIGRQAATSASVK